MAKLTTLAIDLSYMSFKPVLKGTKLNTKNSKWAKKNETFIFWWYESYNNVFLKSLLFDFTVVMKQKDTKWAFDHRLSKFDGSVVVNLK